MTILGIVLTLSIRIALVSLFLPFSALDKILNFNGAVTQAREVAPGRMAAIILIVAGLSIEIFMSIGVMTGIADRLCAFVLGVYCWLTALLWKPFWKPGDFWQSSSGQGRTLFWDFVKNVALGAGFLLITFGSDARSVRFFLENPLASSHPYALTTVP